MAHGGSNDDVIDDVTTMKGQGRDPNIFKAHIISKMARDRDLVTMGHL